jgi:hypothetical protein
VRKTYQIGPLSAKDRIRLLKALKKRGWKTPRGDVWHDETYHSQYPYTVLFSDIKEIGGNRAEDNDSGHERLFSIEDAIRLADGKHPIKMVILHDNGSVEIGDYHLSYDELVHIYNRAREIRE